MENRTTLQIPRQLLADLRRRRHAGQTYADIIHNALQSLDREHFLDAEYAAYVAATRGQDTLRRVR